MDRMPTKFTRHLAVFAALGLWAMIIVACAPQAPPPELPLSPGIPTAQVVQGTASTTGLTIQDRCITAHAVSREGPWRLSGGGLDMEVALDSLQTFSQVTILAADAICNGGATRADAERLVASVNGTSGASVVQYSWSGA